MEQFSRRINIYIDSGNAQQSYDVLAAKQSKLNTELEDLRLKHKKAIDDVASGNKKAQSTVESLTAKISKTEAAIDTVTQSMGRQQKKITGELAPSYRDLSDTVNRLGRELKRMSEQDDGFAAKKLQYNEAKAALDKYSFSLVSVRNSLAEMLKTAKGIAVGTLIGNSVQAIASAVGNYFTGIITGSAKLSDELSNIKKVSNLTSKQVKELNASFKDLETRTSNVDLRSIAVGLGQIGQAVTKENIDSINKIVVALGDEFQGGASQITTELGVLRNNLQDIKTGNYDQDMLHIGNAINVLGAEGLAVGDKTVDIAKRIGGVAGVYHIQAGQILGMSAAFQELGIDVERGSTAYVKLIGKMASDTDTFAKVAGISVDKFKELVNTDINTALLKVAQGSQVAGNSNVAFAKTLEELESKGAGASELLSKLANGQDIVAKNVGLATEALKGQSSILEEYSEKNDNAAGQLEKLKKGINAFKESKSLNDVISQGINLLNKFVAILSNPAGRAMFLNYLIISTAALIAYNAATIAATLSTTRNTIVTTLQGIVFRAQWVALAIGQSVLIAYRGALDILTGRTTIAIAVQRIWATVMSFTNPISLAITAITALGAALLVYMNNVKDSVRAARTLAEINAEAAKSTLEQTVALKTNLEIARDKSLSDDVRIAALNKLKDLDKEHLGNLTLENINTQAVKESINQYSEALIKNAKIKAIEGKMVELNGKILENNTKDIESNLSVWDRFKGEIQGHIMMVDGTTVAIVNESIARSKENKILEEQVNLLYKNRIELEKGTEASRQYMASLGEIDAEGNVLINSNKGTGKSKDSNNDTKKLTDEEIAAEKEKAKLAEDLRNKNKSELEKFYADVAKLEEESRRLKLTSDEKEIADAQDKYDELQRRRKDFEQKKLIGTQESLIQEKRIRELMEEEFAKISEKQFTKRSDDEYNATLRATERYYAEQKLAATKSYAEGEINEQQYNATLDAITLQHAHVKVQIAQDYSASVKQAAEDVRVFQQNAYQQDIEANIKAEKEKQRLLQEAHNNQVSLDNGNILNAEGTSNPDAIYKAKREEITHQMEWEIAQVGISEEKKYEIQAEYAAKLRELNKQNTVEMVNNIGSKLNAVVDLSSSFSRILTNVENAQLNREKENNKKSLNAYKKQLDQKLISEDQYSALVTAANERMDAQEREIKRKQFQREKAINLSKAIINTALGVARAFADYAFPYSLIPAAAVGVAGGLEIAAIASEQPTFATGGIVKGASHAEGGISLVDGKSGRKVGEMEGGEPYMILSRETMANNGPLINDLLNASLYGGGRRVNSKYYQPNSLNATRAFENITYANGGIKLDGVAKSADIFNTTTGATNSMTNESLNLMKEQNNLLNRILEKRSETSITDFKEKEKLYNYMIKQQQL